jgi:hypothetical protein
MHLCLEVIRLCDVVWVFGDRVTDGMRAEIDFAYSIKKYVFFVSLKAKNKYHGANQ